MTIAWRRYVRTFFTCIHLVVIALFPLRFSSGATDLGRALHEVHANVFKQHHGDRDDVENVIIIISDAVETFTRSQYKLALQRTALNLV